MMRLVNYENFTEIKTYKKVGSKTIKKHLDLELIQGWVQIVYPIFYATQRLSITYDVFIKSAKLISSPDCHLRFLSIAIFFLSCNQKSYWKS
jgi:hypothetical protein